MTSLEATLGRQEERICVAGKTYTLARPPAGALLAYDREWRRLLKNPLRRAAEVAATGSLVGDALESLWRIAYEQEKEWNRQSIDDLLANEFDSKNPAFQFRQLVATCFVVLWKYHRDEISTFDAAEAWLEKLDDLKQLEEKLLIVLPPDPKKNVEVGPSPGPT